MKDANGVRFAIHWLLGFRVCRGSANEKIVAGIVYFDGESLFFTSRLTMQVNGSPCTLSYHFDFNNRHEQIMNQEKMQVCVFFSLGVAFVNYVVHFRLQFFICEVADDAF